MRDSFSASVTDCLHGNQLFSFLSCVLSSPENIEDWPDSETFRKVLLALLSDHSFLSWEVYPTAKGQHTVLDFVGMMDSKKQNTSRSLELWDESKMVSHLQKRLEERYHQIVRPQSMLMDLELSVAQKNLFRNCIAEIVGSVLQKEAAPKEPSYYEENLEPIRK